MAGPTAPPTADQTTHRLAANALRAARANVDSATYHPSGSCILGPALPSASDLVRAREAASMRCGKKGEDGYEADESTLLGSGDEFRHQCVSCFLPGVATNVCDSTARRDAARKWFEEKRATARDDKVVTVHERAVVMGDKDKATMGMFQQLAKQRFG